MRRFLDSVAIESTIQPPVLVNPQQLVKRQAPVVVLGVDADQEVLPAVPQDGCRTLGIAEVIDALAVVGEAPVQVSIARQAQEERIGSTPVLLALPGKEEPTLAVEESIRESCRRIRARPLAVDSRSEERRVGKECRSRGAPGHCQEES